jgi:hypothetical protein
MGVLKASLITQEVGLFLTLLGWGLGRLLLSLAPGEVGVENIILEEEVFTTLSSSHLPVEAPSSWGWKEVALGALLMAVVGGVVLGVMYFGNPLPGAGGRLGQEVGKRFSVERINRTLPAEVEESLAKTLQNLCRFLTEVEGPCRTPLLVEFYNTSAREFGKAWRAIESLYGPSTSWINQPLRVLKTNL